MRTGMRTLECQVGFQQLAKKSIRSLAAYLDQLLLGLFQSTPRPILKPGGQQHIPENHGPPVSLCLLHDPCCQGKAA